MYRVRWGVVTEQERRTPADRAGLIIATQLGR